MNNIFKFHLTDIQNVSGQSGWKSPSNIALIKYWGKYGEQLPANSSLSFTLSNCKTKTVLKYQLKKEASKSFDFEIFLVYRSQRAINLHLQPPLH